MSLTIKTHENTWTIDIQKEEWYFAKIADLESFIKFFREKISSTATIYIQHQITSRYNFGIFDGRPYYSVSIGKVTEQCIITQNIKECEEIVTQLISWKNAHQKLEEVIK